MSKEYWNRACKDAINGPHKQVATIFGAVVVSSNPSFCAAVLLKRACVKPFHQCIFVMFSSPFISAFLLCFQHLAVALAFTLVPAECRICHLRGRWRLLVPAVVAPGLSIPAAHLETLRLVHGPRVHWQLHWSGFLCSMGTVALQLLSQPTADAVHKLHS